MVDSASESKGLVITVSGPDDNGILERIARCCDSAVVNITEDIGSCIGDQAIIALRVVGTDDALDQLCDSLSIEFPEDGKYSLATADTPIASSDDRWQPFRFRLVIRAQDDAGLLAGVAGFLNANKLSLVFHRGERYLPHIGSRSLGSLHHFEFRVPLDFNRSDFQAKLEDFAREEGLLQWTLTIAITSD